MAVQQSLAYGLQLFRHLGISDEQFYGIAGSAMGESGPNLDPNAFNASDPYGGAQGIFQFVGPRRAAFKEYCKMIGKSESDYTAAWDFAAHELQTTEQRTLQRILATDNRHDASKVWTDSYERPNQKYANHDLRANYADNVAAMFGNGSVGDWNGDPQVNMSTSGPLGTPGAAETLAQLGGEMLGQTGAAGVQLPDIRPTAEQSLGMLAAALAANKRPNAQFGGDYQQELALNSKFALDMFGGPGHEARQLNPREAMFMGLGGILGGVPGAMAGDVLNGIVTDLFTPKPQVQQATDSTIHPIMRPPEVLGVAQQSMPPGQSSQPQAGTPLSVPTTDVASPHLPTDVLGMGKSALEHTPFGGALSRLSGFNLGGASTASASGAGGGWGRGFMAGLDNFLSGIFG